MLGTIGNFDISANYTLIVAILLIILTLLIIFL